MTIKSFNNRKTERFFKGERVARWAAFEKAALRKLDMLDAAEDLKDLKSPPGNRLEALKGERKGQHSIRINDQWRVCFIWRPDGAHDVEIIDYH
ncbi:type II toxin-antitoxin system RelE/ParE family toxin [Hyphococcus sp.]|uniref:type II toxin-antitoxin system RelE/ParE family toxin n=1 Tax=Hyphococcus sp. TaxID=2038636 RepID=UPI00207DF0C5|nr:MAG: killer protein [Marinicaulis sp.]